MTDERNEWISKRAYALWDENGRPYGSDQEHWLRASAERELMEATRASDDGREVIELKNKLFFPRWPAVSPAPGENVIVVDDEPEIRFNTASTLEDAGYRAFEAANASEALVWLRKVEVKALVTDVNMPGPMDGIGLVKQVISLWPRTKIVITSGLVRLRASDLAEDVIFLSKPFPDSSLLAALKS